MGSKKFVPTPPPVGSLQKLVPRWWLVACSLALPGLAAMEMGECAPFSTGLPEYHM